MAHYLKNGNTYRVAADAAIDMRRELPAGNYSVKFDSMGGYFFLEMIDSFEIKGKLYGDVTRHADRILNTFEQRPTTTGVMLTGEKGSGKTLLTKQVVINAAKLGIPCLVINTAWHGDGFNSFIQSIDQRCVILFDEFEKVYDSEEQEAILTLLDGTFPTKKLFLMTCNDKWKVDIHMRNRPGRIFYMIDFTGLSMEFIREYCEDNLQNKEHLEGICRVATVFDKFNFDMLKAMVEEINRYNEPPTEVIKILNTKPEYSNKAQYDVTMARIGTPQISMPQEMLRVTEWTGNPLMNHLGVGYNCHGKDCDCDAEYKKEPDSYCDTKMFVIKPDELKSVNANAGTFTYEKEGFVVTLKRQKEHYADYSQMF